MRIAFVSKSIKQLISRNEPLLAFLTVLMARPIGNLNS